MALSWTCAAGTDQGLRRARNEDALLTMAAARLYAVADGMGGHAAGDVASRVAVRILSESFERPPSALSRGGAAARRLADAFESANHTILEMATRDPTLHGMGTTLTAVATPARGSMLVIAHIGDSRAYRFRDGRLEQLTEDHTWVQQQVDAGMLTGDEARRHPLSSVLTRVLGTTSESAPDVFETDAQVGDVLLLCSDGLCGVVDDDRIAEILAMDEPLDAHKDRLIQAALDAGGPDNITVVLLEAG